METIDIRHDGLAALPGARPWGVVGVVASGNLEILLERAAPPAMRPAACASPSMTAAPGPIS
jgi:hypothetical protein